MRVIQNTSHLNRAGVLVLVLVLMNEWVWVQSKVIKIKMMKKGIGVVHDFGYKEGSTQHTH